MQQQSGTDRTHLEVRSVTVLYCGWIASTSSNTYGTSRSIYTISSYSHAYFKPTESNWVSANGNYQTSAYTIASAFTGVCEFVPAAMGVMTHEYMHAYRDLIDLYDTAVDPDSGKINYLGKGIGTFDIMANPYGVNQDDENFPTHLSPWSKQQLKWVDPIVLNTESPLQDTYTVRPSELYPDIYRINLENFMGLEYLLIENRQRKEFDIHLFGSGLLIYHVDDSLESQDYRGYPGQEGWPNNAQHYRVALLQADGKYDLEKGENRGDEGDFWQKGMTLGPNEDGNTYPNTDTYGTQYGVYPTGVIVEVVDQIGDDFVIRVTLPDTLLGAPQKEGVNNTLVPPTPAPKPNEISGKFDGPWMDGWRTAEDGAPPKDDDDDKEEFGGSGSPPLDAFPLGNLFQTNTKEPATDSSTTSNTTSSSSDNQNNVTDSGVDGNVGFIPEPPQDRPPRQEDQDVEEDDDDTPITDDLFLAPVSNSTIEAIENASLVANETANEVATTDEEEETAEEAEETGLGELFTDGGNDSSETDSAPGEKSLPPQSESVAEEATPSPGPAEEDSTNKSESPAMTASFGICMAAAAVVSMVIC